MLTIEIAGVPFEVRCRFEERSREYFKDYLTEKPPLFSVEPTMEDRERFREGIDLLAEAYGRNDECYKAARLEHNVLYSLIAEKLVNYGVLLIHGSALCMDGKAYIFTAPSGTGKSTHARLWREMFGDRVWMVNDDKPMLKIGEDGIMVYGSPWRGKHRLGRNASAPLKAIVSLHRDEANHIEPMNKTDAFLVLMEQAFISQDRAVMMKVLDLEKHLMEKADFYTLGCNMLPEAAQEAWEGINDRQLSG